MADIRIYPYISSPHGIEVCYSINGGPVRQKRFPAGTTREAIIADLDGRPLAPVDRTAEIAAKKAQEKAQRAAAAQPEQTASEDQLKQQDSDKDAKIAELNMMRAALRVAKVRGYQLFNEKTLREKYAELLERQASGKGE